MSKILIKVVEKEPCVNVVQCWLEYGTEKIMLREINPMIRYNNGISWGYRGGGPSTLTELLRDILYFDNEEDYGKSYNIILNYIAKIDQETDFKIYLDDLGKLCNVDTDIVFKDMVDGDQFNRITDKLYELLELTKDKKGVQCDYDLDIKYNKIYFKFNLSRKNNLIV
jgi:hypothetical protein